MVAFMKTKQGQRSVPFTLPAPVGGLNGRDGLANMPPGDAFVLDNWFPDNTTVNTRKGNTPFATGVPGPVESLENYVGGAQQKMLIFGGGNVYVQTVAGPVGAPIATGKNSNRVVATMFSNAGNQFLIGVTGADAPFSFDGTTYTALAITGLTGSQNTLHNVFTFKERLYFCQKDQLGFYYLAPGAIQGAASYFDLSQVAQMGGHLQGIASFSSDSGTGLHDYIVFMTSVGEYIVYEGTNPASAATWSLVSRYYSSPPIGRKGWFNFRSDLYIICAEGVVSFAQIRSNGASGQELEFLSSKLGKYITSLNPYVDTHGWCAVIYPKSGMLLINAPTTGSITSEYYQFVMNMDTNAWCRFRFWPAISWVNFNRNIYFGRADGRVSQADEGFLDDGQPIKCDARQANNYFDDGKGMGSADKQFHFATFIMESDGTPPVSAELNVNFQNKSPLYAGNLEGGVGAFWDVATWDVDFWAGEGIVQNFTVPFGKIGYVASVWLRAYLQGTSIKWYATRVICERCKGLVII